MRDILDGKERMARSPFEWFVLLVVAGLVIGAVFLKVQFSEQRYQEEALIAELKAIRTAISLHLILERRPPNRLTDLVEKKMALGPAPRPFLTHLSPNGEGKFIDPFGNPFQYNSQSGWVNSTTEGYKDW